MSTRDRFVRGGFITCAVIGALILLAAITIEIVGVIRSTHYELPHKVYLIGMLFGFVGFFGLDKKSAIDGTTFIVDIAGRIVPLLRAGRRKTDPLVPVDEKAAKIADGAVVDATAIVTTPVTPPKRESDG